MNEYYVETSCGKDTVRRMGDDTYLTPYEIVELLNSKDKRIHELEKSLKTVP